MCKFHKDVAISVATSPVSGAVDPVLYSLTLCALAKFWVSKYMPDMGHLDGSSNYELCTDEAQTAFQNSGLPRDVRTANDGFFERRDFLLATIGEYIREQRIDNQSLNLPTSPDKNSRFLDVVTMSLYEGDAVVGLQIKPSADDPKHEPLRAAMDGLYKKNGFAKAIEDSLRASISNLFIDAPRQVNPRLLSFYNRFPMGLRTAFGSCSLHSGGGALAHISVCGALNVGIGGFSGAFLNTAMYAIAPAMALGTTHLVEKYRMNDFNPYKYALPAVLSLAAAFGAAKVLPHEHSADPRMQWFYSFNAEQRHNQLQKDYQRYLNLPDDLQHQVDREASRQKMTVSLFMTSLEVCGGDLTPKIEAFEAERLKNFQPLGLQQQRLH